MKEVPVLYLSLEYKFQIGGTSFYLRKFERKEHMIRSMYRQIWSALKTRSYDAFNFVCTFNPVCFEHQPEVGYDENSIKGRIGRSLGDLTFV